MTKFLSYSILLHLLVLVVLTQYGSFNHGVDAQKKSMNGARTVYATIAAISEKRGRVPEHSAIHRVGEQRKIGRDSDSKLIPANTADKMHGNSVYERIKRKSAEKAEDDAEGVPMQGYFVAGKLTRLPVPLIPVDLNIPPISHLQPNQSIQITLLIDANGGVARVIRSSDDEKSKEFFELIAAQFRKVEFAPGEIEGERVKSQLTIAVISEPG
jgi:hypothetical protein